MIVINPQEMWIQTIHYYTYIATIVVVEFKWARANSPEPRDPVSH